MLNISWKKKGIKAIKKISLMINNHQWKILISYHNFNNPHDRIDTNSYQYEILVKICESRLNLIYDNKDQIELLDSKGFEYLIDIFKDESSDPKVGSIIPTDLMYYINDTRVYSIISHLLLITHLSICKMSQYPRYVGPYIIDVIVNMINSTYDIVTFALWCVKLLLLGEIEGYYQISSYPSIVLLSDECDFNLQIQSQFSKNDSKWTLQQLFPHCINALKYEWVNGNSADQSYNDVEAIKIIPIQEKIGFIKTIPYFYVRLFISLSIYLTKCNISDNWMYRRHNIKNQIQFHSLLSDPIIIILDLINEILN